ncbi:hypothetical protein B0H13DRAFT_947994 [Mycena leptocephala]|nr:hypothetical protein B0H13DRAFT_947994 [Mycena leptocephala]
MPPPASPPSFFPAPYRIADEPSPSKRQRRSSTPRQPRASSSATPDDINSEREASAMRMLDVWSGLAEKYSRRIDQDDIVDLVTGEIVKDRGVLSAETPWKFGRFADDSVDESTGTDEDEDDDIDELDAFAGSTQVSPHGWTVPPVRTMDPADAKDLEEFMEAERRRREECGDEEASEDDGGFEDADKDSRDAPEAVSIPVRVELDDSDDELGNWGIVDESNLVFPVGKTTDDSETIEIVDSPSVSPTRSFTPNFDFATPKSETPPQFKIPPDRNPHPRMQLHTPPQSRTPSILSRWTNLLPLGLPHHPHPPTKT